MPVPRRTKISLAIASFVIVLPVVALILLLTFDWNRVKPWLNARVSTAIERPFAIRGDLALTWQREHGDSGAGRWANIVPWPHLLAKDVHVGNPTALASPATNAANAAASTGAGAGANANASANANVAAADDMASVSQLSFSLNPFALLNKTISIPELRFQAPLVALQRRQDGSNNWTFGDASKPSPWTLDLQRLVFTKGTVKLADAQQHINATAEIDTISDHPNDSASNALASGPGYGIVWNVSGTYNGATVTGEGKAGAVLSLQKEGTPFPLAASIKMAGTSLAVEGTLTRPTDLAALDMRLKVAGPSMARLYALTGLVLPETPPFFTAGHLTGNIGRRNSHWTYDKFIGKVGSSDIAGMLDYRSRAPRGLLSGNVHSRQLVFADLGPLVGADSASSKKARGATQVQPSGRVLPVETFKTERWTSIDADVVFSAGQIVRDKQLPISDLETHIRLQDGVLALSPLNFTIAGGTLRSNIELDGSGKVTHKLIRAKLDASARHLELKQLFPTLDALQASAGQVNGDAKLSAVGNSVATLLGTSNGEVKTLINQGTISKLLLEEMGLNVGNIVLAKVFGDKQVKLNCLATDFAVTNGLMQTRTFIVDTDEAVLHVSGDINLDNEKMDLTLKPDTKGLRIFSLHAPLYVRGTFSDPAVSVDKGVLALRAGGAVALAVVAPFAALLPLVNTGPGGDSACASLLAQARVAPVAPAPGKTLGGHKAQAGSKAR